MTALFAVLISAVLLNQMDMPVPKYHLIFADAHGKVIEVVTDKDGRFQVDLAAPGTYRFQVGLGKTETITVDKDTSGLKLKLTQPPPPIEIIQPRQMGNFNLPA